MGGDSFELLLILCGFGIMHSDPVYLPVPLNLSSALATPPTKQNQCLCGLDKTTDLGYVQLHIYASTGMLKTYVVQ